MPYVDVDIEDFLSSCRKTDLENIIVWLEEEGALPTEKKRVEVVREIDGRTYRHEKFLDALHALAADYNAISAEETDMIINLAKKYSSI